MLSVQENTQLHHSILGIIFTPFPYLVDIRLKNYYRTRKRRWIWLVIELKSAFDVTDFSGFHAVVVPPASVGAAWY
jgi:hypothetical protein